MRRGGETSFKEVAKIMHANLKELLDCMYGVLISSDHNAITFGTIQKAW